jgi:phosphoserine aminotransferase
MNVPFRIAGGDAKLEKLFVDSAAAASPSLINLAGHRSVGGLRASIYNAMPQSGVAALIEFMRTFQAQHCNA